MKKFLTKEIQADDVYASLTIEDLLEGFPTGKPHVSFSEIAGWDACQLRHYLEHVLKLATWEENPYADLGTSCHDVAETYIDKRVLDVAAGQALFKKLWTKNYENYSEKTLERLRKQYKVSTDEGVFLVYNQMIEDIMVELPAFMDDTFPGWEPVNAEEFIYEQIPGDGMRFKGYVDAIIKCKNKRGKELIWLIDWKTCGWGWTVQQKRDPIKAMQLGYYKIYYAQKRGLDLKDVRCAFVLLKRDGKKGARIEPLTVSVGPKAVDRANEKATQMLSAVRKGFRFKNRKNCRFCPWQKTERCP